MRDETFLGQLDPTLKSRLLSGAIRVTYLPGEVIFRSGDCETAGVVECGLVCVLDEVPGELAFTYRHVAPGGVVGLSALIGVRGNSSAVAVGRVDVRRFRSATIAELRQDPGFNLAVAKEVIARLRDHGREAILRSRGNLSRRLALELLRLAAEYGVGTPVRLPVTHEALAENLGTSREVVTRLLRQLAKADLVVQEGRGKLLLADLERLVAFDRDVNRLATE